MAISTGAALLGGALLGGATSLIGGNKAANASERAANLQAQQQQAALDYQKQVEELPLELRGEAAPLLAGFYGIGEQAPGAQQQLINQVMDSPFYQANTEQMEEAIMRNAARTGGLRSGDVQSALATEQSNLLQQGVNQQLQGLSAFAFPNLNTNAIANTMQGIGQTQAQGALGAAQARQAGYGGAANAITQGIAQGIQSGMFSPSQPTGMSDPFTQTGGFVF